MDPDTPPSVLPPTAKHSATAVFLHGYGDGARGTGWADLFDAAADGAPWVRWVFPHARVGQDGKPSWYGFEPTDGGKAERREDEGSLMRAVDGLDDLLRSESRKHGPGRVVLGGFSQGAAVALMAAVAAKGEAEGGLGAVAGVFAMGGFVPLKSRLPELLHPTNPNLRTPILFLHGLDDAAVPPARAEANADLLRTAGFADVRFKGYPGLGHTANAEEIGDAVGFVVRCLPR
ncbi:Alpha/Beta hydrolase protein [Hyaloraphidium curvatum]|nr:Alpha/Beta hydrolase protein [Hyaloraphidium curvatum]